MSTLDILIRYRGEFLSGLAVTLQLCAIVWAASLLLGLIIGTLSLRFPRAVGLPSRCASLFIAGVPAIVLLFWLHYPAQAMANVVVPPFVTGSVAISLIGMFMVADAVRDALAGFPTQYAVAGRVCGLNERQVLFSIKFPIVARQLAPTLIMIAVGLFQATLFTSFISVDEVFRVAQRVNSVTYRPIEVFSVLAVFCIVVCVPFVLLSRALSRRYSRDTSER